jgi:hypothetical protein
MYQFLALLPTALAQGQWAQRVYWSDNTCSSTIALAIQVSIPQAPCSSTTPLNQICEVKAKTTTKSSEGTGCVSTDKFTDSPWFPNTQIGKPVPNASYMSLTQYGGLKCDPTLPMEQNTFVANGECFAIETENSFFKAICDESSGKIDICKDDKCLDCGTHLNAGTFQSLSGVFKQGECIVGGLALKMTCLNANAVGLLSTGKPLPTKDTDTKSGGDRSGFSWAYLMLGLFGFY